MYETVGQMIAKAREEKGLSKRELSRLANISDTELARIESGKREMPNPKTLRKISQYIDINYNDLMYAAGLGFQVSPLNPFIKSFYSNLKGEELNAAEINVLGSIENNKKLIESCEENLKKENITDKEKELLLNTIEDTKYQINTSNEIIKLIQSIKVKERNKNAKN